MLPVVQQRCRPQAVQVQVEGGAGESEAGVLPRVEVNGVG